MKRLSLPPALLLLALIINTGISTMAQTQTTDPATPSARPNDTATAPSVPAPPVAKKIPRTSTVHDTTLSDDYFWMRDKKNPEVISYLEAENAYTAAMMKQTAGLQERLYKEMLARIKETDTNVP
ncbi:MAG: oligopeptidase, partial [Acidobacteriota bacterium]|nr:oligopeptidase [Acidobacteriota bacterium]